MVIVSWWWEWEDPCCVLCWIIGNCPFRHGAQASGRLGVCECDDTSCFRRVTFLPLHLTKVDMVSGGNFPHACIIYDTMCTFMRHSNFFESIFLNDNFLFFLMYTSYMPTIK